MTADIDEHRGRLGLGDDGPPGTRSASRKPAFARTTGAHQGVVGEALLDPAAAPERGRIQWLLDSGFGTIVLEAAPPPPSAGDRVPVSTAGDSSLALPTVIAFYAATEAEAQDLMALVRHDASKVYIAPPRSLHVIGGPIGTASSGPPSGGSPPSSGGPPVSSANWGFQAIRAPRAWAHTKYPARPASAAIHVAIVDTGVDRDHPDLKPSISKYETFSAPEDDTVGHGTHVAGIVAGTAAAQGGTGDCVASMEIYKAIGDTYDPVPYYKALREAESAHVVNLSIGGDTKDPTEELLVRRALRRGSVVVAAIGNNGAGRNSVSYPAALPDVIAVGAVNQSLTQAPFSNSGPHIHLVAPGVQIRSTLPRKGCSISAANTYGDLDGTSMAAPFVSGCVAAMLTAVAMPSSLVRAKRRARFCPGQSTFLPTLGHGLLDMAETFDGL